MAREDNVDPSIYINKFKGINNVSDPHNIDNNDLADAINVDINKDNTISSRDGFIKKKDYTDAHSLFSDNKNIYLINEDNLLQLNESLSEKTIDIGYKGLKTSFISHNNSIIISNKNFIKRFKRDKVYDISPQRFNNSFLVRTFPNGGFSKGRYLISCTYVFDDGIEGGTTSPIEVTLNEDALGIEIYNLPVNFDLNVTTLRVYISTLNAKSQKFYDDYDISTNSIFLTNRLTLGRDLEQYNLSPLKSGELMDVYNGVIFTSKDNIVHMSEKLSYLSNDRYYEFDGDITLLCATKNGLYVSDEYSLYFLSGSDAHNLDKNIIYQSPAIKYSQSKNIMTNEVFFYTQMGLIVGDQDGGIKNITEEKFMPTRELLEGASLIKYQNGNRQIISSFKVGDNTGFSMGDSVQATIERAKN